MTTFSQLVDALVSETRRPDLVNDVATYLNQTIREVHFRPDNNGAVMFRDNLCEALLVANSDSSFTWDVPDPGLFQAMQVVKYFGGCTEYPPERVPSRRLADETDYYYRAGSTYAFSGYGGNQAQIGLAYYQYPRKLLYRPAATRYAEYDVEAGWTYATADTPELQLAARTLCSNWLLMRWEDVIAEGLRAKIYKRVSDTDRARTCYSQYTSLRMGLITSESADLTGYA